MFKTSIKLGTTTTLPIFKIVSSTLYDIYFDIDLADIINQGDISNS